MRKMKERKQEKNVLKIQARGLTEDEIQTLCFFIEKRFRKQITAFGVRHHGS